MACAAKADIAQGEDVGILLLLLLLVLVLLLMLPTAGKQACQQPQGTRNGQAWPGLPGLTHPGRATFSAGAGHNYAFGVGRAAV